MGYGALCMTNLFAFRATEPEIMKTALDPVGPENDRYLIELAKDGGVIVAAWGTNGTHLGRDAAVRAMIPSLQCLKKTNAGHPGHPLYVRADLKPIPF